MSLELVTLRLLHILLGAFWAGTLIFNALFLAPAMTEAGPDAGKVMAGIQRRRFLDVMPLVALVTVISGLWLYWRISDGFDPAFSRSRLGMAYGAGGVLAIVALVLGVGILRPSMMKVMQLGPRAHQTTDAAEREVLMGQVTALRRRSTMAGRVIAVLLAFATALMAVARYL